MFHLRYALIIALLLLSCKESDPPELASIESVLPETLEPGDTLKIFGNGFVEGRCSVMFNGHFKTDDKPNGSKRTVQVFGTAVSEQLIEVPMNGKTIQKLALEPTAFKGKIEVDFPIEESAVKIGAHLSEVSFQLTPGGLGVATAAKRERLAGQILSILGIQLGDPKMSEELVVVAVQPGSAAEKAGIDFGDRILGLNGESIDSAAAFSRVDPQDPQRIELVNSIGIIKEVSLSPVLPQALGDDELTAVVLTCIALGMFLAFGAPRRGRDPKTMILSSDPFTQAVCVAAVSAPLALLPAFAVLGFDGIPLLLTLFTIQGGTLGLLLFISTGKGTVGMLPRLLVIPVVVGVTAVQSSALGLHDIVESQQHGPFGPHALNSPVTFLLAVSALSLIWPGRRELIGRRENRRRLKSALRWVSATSAACIVTTCLLGGWGIPFYGTHQMDVSPQILLGGTLVFLVKTWLVLMAARWMAASSLLERRGKQPFDLPFFRTIALLLSGAAAVYYHLSDLFEPMRAAGHVVACALFVTVASALIMMSVTSALHTLKKSGKSLNPRISEV